MDQQEQKAQVGRPRKHADSRLAMNEHSRQYYQDHAEAIRAARWARYAAQKQRAAVGI